MAYKLYTTYISKMKNIPEGVLTAIVMRMPPASIFKRENTIHIPQLSPKKEVLYSYKNSDDWDEFEKNFLNQMTENEETVEYLNMLMMGLEHNSVCIVCCEKDNSKCHRRLIAEYLKELGYEWEEL